KGRKFDSKGEEGRLIGFNVPLQSYRIITAFGKIVESKHVRFLKGQDTVKLDLEEDIEFFPEEAKRVNDHPAPENEPNSSSDHRENSSDCEEFEDAQEQDSDSSRGSETEIEKQLTQRDSSSPPQQPPTTTRVLRDRSQIKPP
ncbi:hypothetical protein VP01_4841g3, partial [Puccinia sorghi]